MASVADDQGTAANLGMYAFGIPMGVITDRKSPRLTGVIGMVCLFGYYPIRMGMSCEVVDLADRQRMTADRAR